MEDQPYVSVYLDGPGDAVAAIPYLLGFHPTDCVVVLGLGGTPSHRICATLYADVPSPADYVAFAHEVAIGSRQQGALGVVLVVVGHGETEPPALLPHQELIDLVEHELRAHDIAVAHLTWAAATTAGSHWRCYDAASDCQGVVPSPDQSPLAAASVAAGQVTFASRTEFEDTLGPDNDVALARRAARILELAAQASAANAPTGQIAIRTALSTVQTAIRTPPDELELDDEAIAQLAVALDNGDVRVLCLGEAIGVHAAAAEQLWTQLVRSTPMPHRAHPAALLAASAYLRGEGALANLALSKAEAAQPSHLMAGLLRLMISAGLHPSAVAQLVRRITDLAKRELGIGST